MERVEPEPDHAETPSLPRMLLRGMLRRCPRCGAGHLFRRWFRMVERCPGCGYRFEREEGFQLGGYVINFGVTEGLVCLVLAGYIVAASSNPDASIWPVAIAGLVAAVVTPVLFYPFSRTIWAAIDLTLTPLTVLEQAEAETARAAGSTSSDAPGRAGRAP